MRMVKMGVMAPVVGMKPEKRPRTAGWTLLIGRQGLEKAACTTEWFCGGFSRRQREFREAGREGGEGCFTFGKNWNCTRLPGAATSEFGTKDSVLFMVETLTTCVTTLLVAIAAGGMVLEPSVIMSAVEVALVVMPVAIIIALGLLVVMPVGRMTFVVTLVPMMMVGLLAMLVPRIIVGLLIMGVVMTVVEDLDVVGMSIIIDVDELFIVTGISTAVVVMAFVVVPAIITADVLFAIGSLSVDAFGSISAETIGSICAQTLPASKAKAVRDIGRCIARI